MIIKKLSMHNFGIYAGDNQFIFEGKKPVVLIGGMNGRGKTTFLEAVLLALYGPNSSAYLESGQKSYMRYLKSFVNIHSEDKTCSVELAFEMKEDVREEYVVKREWDILGKSIKEKIYVTKDGSYNEFLTNNWQMFVENILPSALSSFFFFNGEKIAQLAVDNTNIQLKQSIRVMLGISILDILSKDILRNLKRLNKRTMEGKTSEEIHQLRKEKEDAVKALFEIDAELESANLKLSNDNTSLEALHQLYTTKGGDAFEKRQETIKKRATLRAELTNIEKHLYDLIADLSPLLLVKELVSDIKLQATDEHNEMVMQEAILLLNEMYEDFSKNYKGDIVAESAFMDFVKKKTSENQTKIIYALSDQALFQVNNLIENDLREAYDNLSFSISKKRKMEKQIDELDSYLTIDINEKELEEIYEKIKTTEQLVIEDKVRISELEKKRVKANSLVLTLTSEFKKNVETYLSKAELKDSKDRVVKYSNMALEIVERYRVELQKRKTEILAQTITDCYKKIANKKNLIQKIVINAETLDMMYISEDGTEISKNSLSAGEQQLMVISILWALSICSKKKLPVIIDTPLSRLDSSHRISLITTYFPNAGEQTIVLSTDTEIDASYYQLIKENVGDEFTLNYDEKTKSTIIKKGYLMGAEL